MNSVVVFSLASVLTCFTCIFSSRPSRRIGSCLLWVMSVDSEKDYRSIFRRRTSTHYRSYVSAISVNCRWYIGQLSFEYLVNLSGESNAKTSLITVIMRWGNMWQCEARLLYEANRRALGTKDMVTFFFPSLPVSSPIV